MSDLVLFSNCNFWFNAAHCFALKYNRRVVHHISIVKLSSNYIKTEKHNSMLRHAVKDVLPLRWDSSISRYVSLFVSWRMRLTPLQGSWLDVKPQSICETLHISILPFNHWISKQEMSLFCGDVTIAWPRIINSIRVDLNSSLDRCISFLDCCRCPSRANGYQEIWASRHTIPTSECIKWSSEYSLLFVGFPLADSFPTKEGQQSCPNLLILASRVNKQHWTCIRISGSEEYQLSCSGNALLVHLFRQIFLRNRPDQRQNCCWNDSSSIATKSSLAVLESARPALKRKRTWHASSKPLACYPDFELFMCGPQARTPQSLTFTRVIRAKQ